MDHGYRLIIKSLIKTSGGKMLKKFFILTISLFFILITNSNSQVVKEKSGGFARIQSMGSNPYIIDPFYMTINPAWGAYYDNFIFGDLGSTQTAFGNDGAGQFIGTNFRLSPQLTVGALLTRNDFSGRFTISHLDPNDIVGQINNAVGAGLTDLNNNLEVMATYKSGSHNFGIGIAYASSSNEINPDQGDPTEGSASQIGINLGYLGSMGSSLILDAGFSIVMPGASYTPAGGDETTFSETSIGVDARAFYTLSSKFKVVPAIKFVTTSGTADIAGGTGTNTVDLNSSSVFILGIGLMYESGDFLFAGGPAIVSLGNTRPEVENVSPELTSTTSFFPAWNLGAEWSMLDWLYARFGYVSLTGSITTESSASPTAVDESTRTFYGPTGAYVGLGLKLGNLSLDGTVNTDVLRQGLNNIAGGGATFSYLSLSIYFD